MELRCVCMNLSFRGLLSYARRHDIRDLDALIQATGCCSRCATCKPFIRWMLANDEVPTLDTPLPPEPAPESDSDPLTETG
ncbi:MAG: hypothetical protein HRU75_13005 [Planctomycetia bacterium]|nr:MAG: hypothetical protein HRU75_13005 [Planctomycetia bacterium]